MAGTYTIDEVAKEEYEQVVAVWEASVRATHHFLREEDIAYFKPLIRDTYLDAVELRCVRKVDHQLIGFMGVADHNLEMLFLHPDYRGQHIGKMLLAYAVEEMAVTKLDVNEQNEEAVGFYLHSGFQINGRSKLDASGKPYPILHMSLKEEE